MEKEQGAEKLDEKNYPRSERTKKDLDLNESGRGIP